jgi:hypothetical protein
MGPRPVVDSSNGHEAGFTSRGYCSREVVSHSEIWRGIDKINGGSSFSSKDLRLANTWGSHLKETVPWLSQGQFRDFCSTLALAVDIEDL